MNNKSERQTDFIRDMMLRNDTHLRWYLMLKILINFANLKHLIKKMKAVSDCELIAMPTRENFLTEDGRGADVLLIGARTTF